MSRGTVTLPSRSYVEIPGRHNPAFPAPVPGGIGGPAPLPSRTTTPIAFPVRPTGPVAGGRAGQVKLFTPAIDKQAPYFIGANEGFSIRAVDGSPLQWIRRFFDNNAGVEMFQPQRSATPDWTSNTLRGESTPGSGIPTSRKRFAPGALRRAAYQDEQLFDQLTSRGHPWPIQKPIPMHLRAALRGQPRETRPYWPRLTRYQPAASYSQTTRTLMSRALGNVLPPANAAHNYTAGGSEYGGY